MAERSKRRRGMARMPDTPWSLLGKAGDRDGAALERLCRLYHPALLSHLRCYHQLSPEDAEDIAQGFFQDRILNPGWIGRADPRRGRFRAFLLTSLRNYLRDRLAMENKKDKEILAEADINLNVSPIGEVDVFDLLWSQHVIRGAIERARQACDAAGQPHYWALFEERILSPAIDRGVPGSFAESLQRLGFTSVQQSCNALVTVGRRLQRALRQVVGEYVAATEVDIEIRKLSALAQKNDLVLANLSRTRSESLQ